MNENQQELLNYISQNNLSNQAARNYLRFNSAAQEDKDAVLGVLDTQLEEQRQQAFQDTLDEKAKYEAQVQEDLDNIAPNIKEATQNLESAKKASDDYGMFKSMFWTDYYDGQPDPYTTYLNSLGEFGKVRAESMRLLEEAGNKDLGNMIKAPSYGLSSSFVDSMFSMTGKQVAGVGLEVADLFGSDRAEDLASAAETFGIVNAETKHKEGFATQFSDLTKDNFFGSVVSFMGDQVPNMVLTTIAAEMAMLSAPALFAGGAAAGLGLGGRAALMGKRFLAIQSQAPSLLNMLLRSGGTYADVYRDPNLSAGQKYAHSFFAGVVEGAGDTFLSMLAGIAPNPMKGMAPGMTSKFGKIIGANAVTRSGAKFIGASAGESFQEVSQELATMFSEETILGRDISGAEKLNRVKEAALGGLVMGGAFRAVGAPVRTYQNIRMMADRPGDRTHLEATEAFKEMMDLAQKAMDEDLSDVELKTIEGQIQDIQSKERKRVADRQKAYRVLRRRNPEGFDRVLRIDELVNRKLAQLETLTQEKARTSAKEDIEALIQERADITSEFDGQENVLTPVEKFEDAIEDLDQAINETQSDLDSIIDLEPESDGDLMVLNSLQVRISAMKNKKAALRKALGDVQAATTANDPEGIAQAMAKLDTLLSESLPAEGKTTVEQVEDDAAQDAGQIEATEEAETQEAEPVQQTEEEVDEQPEPETQQEPAEEAGAPLQITSGKGLTESDMAMLPTHLIKHIQNMLRTGIQFELFVHDNKSDLAKAHPNRRSNVAAFYWPRRRQLHISRDATLDEIRHEFAHCMLHDLIKDATFRRRLYKEIEGVWDKAKMAGTLARYTERYTADYVKALGSEELGKAAAVAAAEEEVIVEWLEEHGNEDGVNMLKKRGLYQRFVDFINSLFGDKYGRYAEQYKITNETDFKGILEAFAAGVEVGSEIEIEAHSSTSQDVALDMVSKAYPDMGGKQVTYTIKYPDAHGVWRKSNTSTKVFNDYWHFRNFWASMTGNGKHSWIDNIYYIDSNGNRKNVNIPSPKRDRNGNVLDMEPKIYNWNQREVYSHRGYWRNINDIKTERTIVNNQIKSFERQKQPVPEALTQRKEEINNAMRELAELYDSKDPYLSKYDAIRERVVGSSGVGGTARPDMSNPDQIVKSLSVLQPRVEGSIDDDVITDVVLDKIDDTGVDLRKVWEDLGVKVKSFKDHKGRTIIIVQYDKTDTTTGPGFEIENAITSHATLDHAEDLIRVIENAAKAQAKIEKSMDVKVLVGISVQGDSILSNPRAIDAVIDHYKTLNDEQKVTFFSKLDEVLYDKVISGLSMEKDGKLKKKDSSKYLLNLLTKTFKTMSNVSVIEAQTGKGTATTKNVGTQTIALPVFSEMSKEMQDEAFLEMLRVMKEEGLSIRGNNSILNSLLNQDAAGREFGMTTSQIKRSLESAGLKEVPVADIVGYTQVNIRVSNWDKDELARVETPLFPKQTDRAFSWAIMSPGNVEFFGLPESVSYSKLGKDVMIGSVGKTIGQVDELLADEEKLKEATPVFRYPGRRAKDRGEMKYSEAVQKLKEAKAKLDEELKKDAPLSKAVKDLQNEVSNLEGALKRHADDVKKAQGTGKGSLASKSAAAKQSTTVTTVPEDVAKDKVSLDDDLDQDVAMDSVTNNSWEPRTRSSLQQQIDWMRLKFQDKYAPIMMMQEDIEAKRGARVEGDQNFKRAEELMYGKAHNDLEKLEAVVDQLKQALKDGKITAGQLTDFMYARHAPERNAMLKDRDGVDNGSGLTDQEAEAILASLSKEETAALEKAAAIVDKISQDTRDVMRKFGLESDERIDTFEKMFKNYVPLGGVATDSQDVDNYPYPTGGHGFHVKGSTTKKAKGRKTLAQNIVAQVIQQNAAVKIKARKNEALQSLFNLVAKNPNTKLWNTSDNIPVNDADRAVGVRINGEQKFIIFKDASLAQNLRGMGTQKLDALSRLMAAPANFLRVAFTTRNPEFIVGNFSRDILSAIPNALAEADLDDGSIGGKHSVARKIIQRVPSTLKALLKSDVAGRKLDPVTERYLNEFKEDGGQTGWGFVKPLQQIAAELDAETNEGSKAKKAIKWMEKNSLQHIENMNDAFENSIRLSAYIEAREAGVSREDAAQLAKNITVNFNKSGEYGAVANAYYLFFNASIQGTARIARSLGKLKTVKNMDGTFSKELSNPQKIVMGLALTSGLLAMLNMAMSDEDEDGELFYNKIPDYEKERNLIMMYDGKNYVKIPLPYGYNLFSNFGTALAETMAGERDADDAMWFVANSAFSSFSPVSFGQSENFAKYIAKGAAPTVFKPLIEMAVNETYFGSKVYQTQFPVGAKRPESELAFRSPKAIKSMFQWLNEATGGGEMVSGSVDINPDLFWYPFEYYIGGLGQFGIRGAETTYGVAQMVASGEKAQLQANDIPFLRKVYGEPSRYYDFDLYDNNKEEVMQLYKEIKNDKRDDPERYKGVLKLDKKMKLVEKKLKALRAERRGFDSLPYIERVNKTAEVQEKERLLIMEYNALHEKLRGN